MAAATFESPQVTALLLRSFGFAPNPAGLAFAGIALIIVVVYVIMSAVMQQEDFRQEVIRWAASSALAQGFSEDNCYVTAAQAKRPGMFPGWALCTYSCKSSGNRHPRYLPIEIACPEPVPCAPGYLDPPPYPRTVNVDPIPLDAAACYFKP